MANSSFELFREQSELKTQDFEHKRKINKAITNYDQAVEKGKEQFSKLEKSRKLAKNIKWQAIEKLDELLIEFEKNFIAQGGKIIWASDASEAQQAILTICKKQDAQTIVKSKSMISEEIKLNDFLAAHNIQSTETDLGEFIQQLDGEPPFHMVTPAMHKSKEQIAKLYYNKLNTESNLSPNEITNATRKILREKIINSKISITGANFLVANTGSIALTENEGNIRLATSFANVHIAIAGIEKVIPSLSQLELFWPLLATYGTGQRITTYNTIFNGSALPNEADSAQEIYLVLLDNGRSKLLQDATLRESLYCIKCGACLNACPVFKTIGGHAYNTTYGGPIGAVVSQHLHSEPEAEHLSKASTLCGACSDSCPVHINIHNMIRHNKIVSKKESTQKRDWKRWKNGMLHKPLTGIALAQRKIWNVIIPQESNDPGIIESRKTFKQIYKENNK